MEVNPIRNMQIPGTLGVFFLYKKERVQEVVASSYK